MSLILPITGIAKLCSRSQKLVTQAIDGRFSCLIWHGGLILKFRFDRNLPHERCHSEKFDFKFQLIFQ